MSQTTLFIVVVVLFVGLPVLIVGSMLFAYEGEQSRTRRVLDVLLFHPYALFTAVIFAIMIGSIIFDADWGLGISAPFGTEVIAKYIIPFLVPFGIVASALYLLITQPDRLKHQMKSEDTSDNRYLNAVIDVVHEKIHAWFSSDDPSDPDSDARTP